MEYPLQILTELVLYSEQVTSNSNTSGMVLRLPADGRVLPKHGSKQTVLCILDVHMLPQDRTESYLNDLYAYLPSFFCACGYLIHLYF